MKNPNSHLTDHELNYLKLEVESTRQMGLVSISLLTLLLLCLVEGALKSAGTHMVFLPLVVMLLIFIWIAYRKMVCFSLPLQPKVIVVNGAFTIKHIGRLKNRNTHCHINGYRVLLPIRWQELILEDMMARARIMHLEDERYTVLSINQYSIDSEAEHGLLKIKKPIAGMALFLSATFYFFLTLLYEGVIFNKVMLLYTLVSLVFTIRMANHNRPYKIKLEQFRTSLSHQPK